MAKFCTNTMLSPCTSFTMHGSSFMLSMDGSSAWKLNILMAYSRSLALTMKKEQLPSLLIATIGSVQNMPFLKKFFPIIVVFS